MCVFVGVCVCVYVYVCVRVCTCVRLCVCLFGEIKPECVCVCVYEDYIFELHTLCLMDHQNESPVGLLLRAPTPGW